MAVPRRPMAIIKLRAAFGIGFAVLGLVIAVKIWFFSTAPPNTKLLGSAFTVVLIALGAVRVREYLLAQQAQQSGP